MEPAETPDITSGFIPKRSNASNTPMWANPLAPPPESASPLRCERWMPMVWRSPSSLSILSSNSLKSSFNTFLPQLQEPALRFWLNKVSHKCRNTHKRLAKKFHGHLPFHTGGLLRRQLDKTLIFRRTNQSAIPFFKASHLSTRDCMAGGKGKAEGLRLNSTDGALPVASSFASSTVMYSKSTG